MRFITEILRWKTDSCVLRASRPVFSWTRTFDGLIGMRRASILDRSSSIQKKIQSGERRRIVGIILYHFPATHGSMINHPLRPVARFIFCPGQLRPFVFDRRSGAVNRFAAGNSRINFPRCGRARVIISRREFQRTHACVRFYLVVINIRGISYNARISLAENIRSASSLRGW